MLQDLNSRNSGCHFPLFFCVNTINYSDPTDVRKASQALHWDITEEVATIE